MSAAPDSPPPRGLPELERTGGVRALLLVSAGCLAVQVALTDHGDETRAGAGRFWLVLGLLLLWLIWRRRSRVARGVVVVTSLAGAVVLGLDAAGSSEAALLAVAYLGQAVPLLSSPVRRHVLASTPRRPLPALGPR